MNPDRRQLKLNFNQIRWGWVFGGSEASLGPYLNAFLFFSFQTAYRIYIYIWLTTTEMTFSTKSFISLGGDTWGYAIIKCFPPESIYTDMSVWFVWSAYEKLLKVPSLIYFILSSKKSIKLTRKSSELHPVNTNLSLGPLSQSVLNSPCVH